MLPWIHFTWMSEWVMCFLASSCSHNTGIIHIEHPECSIAMLEKVDEPSHLVWSILKSISLIGEKVLIGISSSIAAI